MILGISGEKGSFSEQAAKIYTEKISTKLEFNYLMDMEGVLDAVETKKVDFGIFPVVNLRGGLVKMAFKAMGKHLFEVIDEIWLEVEQCLLVLPGTNLNDINKIASHPQAIAQCQRYLKKTFKEVEYLEWQNTAKAAKDLSEGKLKHDTAVIAPINSAQIYGLKVLAKSIQDDNPNLTAFIIVKSIN